MNYITYLFRSIQCNKVSKEAKELKEVEEKEKEETEGGGDTIKTRK